VIRAPVLIAINLLSTVVFYLAMAHLPADLFWPAPPTCSTARRSFVYPKSFVIAVVTLVFVLIDHTDVNRPPPSFSEVRQRAARPCTSGAIVSMATAARQVSKVVRRKRVTTPLMSVDGIITVIVAQSAGDPSGLR